MSEINNNKVAIKSLIWGLTLGSIDVALTMLVVSVWPSMLYAPALIRVVYGVLNLPAFIIYTIAQSNSPPFWLALVFIQWFIIGSVGSWLFRYFKGGISNQRK